MCRGGGEKNILKTWNQEWKTKNPVEAGGREKYMKQLESHNQCNKNGIPKEFRGKEKSVEAAIRHFGEVDGEVVEANFLQNTKKYAPGEFTINGVYLAPRNVGNAPARHRIIVDYDSEFPHALLQLIEIEENEHPVQKEVNCSDESIKAAICHFGRAEGNILAIFISQNVKRGSRGGFSINDAGISPHNYGEPPTRHRTIFDYDSELPYIFFRLVNYPPKAERKT